jgi:hypothetical protein
MVITLAPMANGVCIKLLTCGLHDRQGTHLSETERIEQLPLVPVDPRPIIVRPRQPSPYDDGILFANDMGRL